MRPSYLGKIPFAQALERQAQALSRREAVVLGFEPVAPVITLGKRASAEDRIAPEGFEVFAVDRGGQATIHNPGQLVVFPIVPVESVKLWVDLLWQTTRATCLDFGVNAEWNEACPGLYTSAGKIASLGVRVRSGFSTHGVSLNVSNRLEDFAAIRACGVRGAVMDRLGGHLPVEIVYSRWWDNFRGRMLTRPPFPPNLSESLTPVRS